MVFHVIQCMKPKIFFKSPTWFAKENIAYFIRLFFKASISGLKNAYSYDAAGIFKACGLCQGQRCHLFEGKDSCKEGSKRLSNK